jgi:hypothetical protein
LGIAASRFIPWVKLHWRIEAAVRFKWGFERKRLSSLDGPPVMDESGATDQDDRLEEWATMIEFDGGFGPFVSQGSAYMKGVFC